MAPEEITLLISKLSLVVQIFGLLLIPLSLLYAAKQVKHTTNALKANHDWNRRISAQDALSQRNSRIVNREKLTDIFALSPKRTPIPIEELSDYLSGKPESSTALRSYLNYYESLARGVRQGIYDDEIIKIGCRGIIDRALIRFRPYIYKRRQNGSPKAWLEMELLAQSWENVDREIQDPVRSITA